MSNDSNIEHADEEYELWQEDMMVAGASGPGALSEILNYARQYAQDGPVEVFRVKRERIAIASFGATQ